MEYNLELGKAVKEIKKTKAKNVLIQLPDGLKPKATEITKYLKKQTKANIFIWLQSCWGACDYPNIKNIDLLIQFGHASPKELTPKPG
ncbi:MAG: diphthamide synthesis protein [Candidatus Woesearchaeota archaeon]